MAQQVLKVGDRVSASITLLKFNPLTSQPYNHPAIREGQIVSLDHGFITLRGPDGDLFTAMRLRVLPI